MKDEVQAFFDGELEFERLSPGGRFVADRLLRLQQRERETHDVQDIRGIDDLGPWFRIGLVVDSLSGFDGRWVRADEVIDAAARDIHISQWLDATSNSTGIAFEALITDLVDAWCELALTERLELPTAIETSFDVDGPLWRSVVEPTEHPSGTIGDLVEHLISAHGGHARGLAGGRYQVSLDDLEVFVGTELDPDITARTLDEAATTVSALCGIELRDDGAVDDAIEAFRTRSDRPDDLRVVLTRGIGDQVWMDRSLTREVLAERDARSAVDELLVHARSLARLLAPWELQPPTTD